jgi:hypothetical protein
VGTMTSSAPPEQQWADLEIHIEAGRDIILLRVLGRRNSTALRDHLAADGIESRPAIVGSDIGTISNSALETLMTLATNPAVLTLLGTSLGTYIRRNSPKKVTFNENGIRSTEGMSAHEIERLMEKYAKLREQRAGEEDGDDS